LARGVETVVQRVISITSPQTLPNIRAPDRGRGGGVHTARALTLRRLARRLRQRAVDKQDDAIDPRGLGTQLYSAASPNQVIKINAYRR
jgi:hypothetical protein